MAIGSIGLKSATIKTKIIWLFCRISLHAAINKMNPHNLATVFAPTLIGPTEATTNETTLPDMTSDIFLIETLISCCDRIFNA